MNQNNFYYDNAVNIFRELSDDKLRLVQCYFDQINSNDVTHSNDVDYYIDELLNL